jgi:hypothetical protein
MTQSPIDIFVIKVVESDGTYYATEPDTDGDVTGRGSSKAAAIANYAAAFMEGDSDD